MRDRKTGGQAYGRESGGRGADTLAPLPWWLSCCHSVPWWALISLLFLLLFVVFNLLLLLPSPPHPHLLLRSHSPSLCLMHPPSSPSSGGAESFEFNPVPHTSMSKGHVKRTPHYKSTVERKSPLGLYWRRCCTLPIPTEPTTTHLMPIHLPVSPVITGQNKIKHNTGKLSWQLSVAPNGHQRG